MSKLSVVYQNISDIKPYEKNSRKHDEKQVSQVAASIKEFGFTNPILVDENNEVIAGHGRLLASEMLEMDKVPTIKLTGLTDEQKRAYVIADNKLALNSSWDDEMLKQEIEFLQDADFDVDILGWDALPTFVDEIDYSILEEESEVASAVESQVEKMSGEVKRAIQIEFDASNYEEARETFTYLRNEGVDVGYIVLKLLREEKSKIENL